MADEHPAGTDDQVDVSVVLPVLNEEADIGRLVKEVMAQQPPQGGFEAIVVDGGSEDATREIVARLAEEWPNIKLVHNPRRLSSAGRNVGAHVASGRYIMFLDGHCAIPRRDYLLRLVQLFRSTNAECLCRPQPLKDLATGDWGRAIADARHSFLGHNVGSDIFRSTAGFCDPRSAGAAYTGAIIAKLGGYDERFDACEDVEFNHRVARAGYRSYRHPDLAIHYRPRTNLGAFFRQMHRYGRGRARLMAAHPSAVPWILVAITCAALGLVGVATWLPAAAAKAVALAGGIWGVSLLAEGLRMGRLSAHAARIVAVFAVLHAGLILGFWRGLLEVRRFRPASRHHAGPD